MYSSCQLCPGCPVTGNQVVCYSLSQRTTLPLAFDIFFSLSRPLIAGLIYSTPIHLLAKVELSLFLIVHHSTSFPAPQHKVVCKLLLTALCGRPYLLVCSSSVGQSVRSTSTLLHLLPKSLPSFVQHSIPLHGLIQDTHGGQYAVVALSKAGTCGMIACWQ